MRYLPTMRGWIAFVLAVFSFFYFPVLRPALMVESGRGTYVAERVTPMVWRAGALLMVLCLLASVEAFRRGSRADKWIADIAVLLTIGLAVQYFQLTILPVHKWSNQPEPPGAVSGSRARSGFFEPQVGSDSTLVFAKSR